MSESRDPSAGGKSETVDRHQSLRVLCISEMWLGSNARGAFMAIRRLGLSFHVIDEYLFALGMWRSVPMRIVRKLLRPLLVRESAGGAQSRYDFRRTRYSFSKGPLCTEW